MDLWKKKFIIIWSGQLFSILSSAIVGYSVMFWLSIEGRWYGVEFHFIDERAKEIRIGARFGRYDDMQPIVDMIKKTNLVEVLQTNRCLYISEKK